MVTEVRTVTKQSSAAQISFSSYDNAVTIPIPRSKPLPLPAPADIADGATINLECGRVYLGPLDLQGKHDVTVRTLGDCGKAVIIPGRPVAGWAQEGNLYWAPLDFAPEQVAMDGMPMPRAAWPNLPQFWTTDVAALSGRDLEGARLVYMTNISVVATAELTAASAGSIDPAKPFYVEGKLWMLDTPGEWAYADGKLYVWMPDGGKPDGRVWAAGTASGINADMSDNVAIDGVTVLFGYRGISGNKAKSLKIRRCDIAHSAQDGIWNAGGDGLVVERSNVLNSRRNGIAGWYAIKNAVVANTTVRNTGMVNRPTPSYAGIMFGGEQYGTSANNVIDKTKVINSANHGIFIIESVDTKVMNSSVEAPCLVSADCGGIYTNARSLRTLSQQITYNTVTRARGQERIGIYLDDKASGVTVAHNTIVDNEKGMMVHSGYQNDIIDNFFASSRVMHISFPEDAGAPIHDNRVLRNIFRSTAGEQTYNMSGQSPATFGTFDYNVYQSTNPTIFARVNKAGAATTHSFAAWRGTLGQDLHSTMNGRP